MIGIRFLAPSMLLGSVEDNLPYYLEGINVEHTAVWKSIDMWNKIYITFISDEDMSFLILQNPDIEFDYTKLPDYDK